ncbi:MAG: hypothetical protein HY791_13225 [Deltaproteobacteria bacterium]|nr:hypothetical protein [Deltaproteobacteria bacterium]
MWAAVALQLLGTPFVLEQPAITFSLGPDRLTVAPLAERFELDTGKPKRARLAANRNVPARLGDADVRIDFGPAEGAIDAHGDVALERPLTLRDGQGRVSVLKARLVVDILGLADEEPSLRIVEAQIIRADQIAQLATARAPIHWTTPKARLIARRDGTGLVELSAPLTPEYFLDGDRAPIELQSQTVDIRTVAKVEKDTWRAADAGIELKWVSIEGRFVGSFRIPSVESGDTLRIRLGTIDGLSLPLVAEPREEAASLSPMTSNDG